MATNCENMLATRFIPILISQDKKNYFKRDEKCSQNLNNFKIVHNADDESN